MSKFYIYTIHNIINNKIYVGKTTRPSQRWTKHIEVAFCDREKERSYLQRAIYKYGVDNFIFTIFHELNTEEELNLAEKYWIAFYKSNICRYPDNLGYNLTDGGEGISGHRHTEIAKQKIREKAIGRKHSEFTKLKISKLKKGKPVIYRHPKRSYVGKKLSEDHRKNLSKAKIGIKFSEEHRKNISKSNIGKHVGELNEFYSKKHTEEVKILSRGENNKQAKLKSENVLDIRKRYETEIISQQELADEYKVSRKCISHIINRATWNHLKDKNDI